MNDSYRETLGVATVVDELHHHAEDLEEVHAGFSLSIDPNPLDQVRYGVVHIA